MPALSVIKAANRSENWPAVIERLRHDDLISIEEQRLLADMVEALIQKYDKKDQKSKRRNERRRNEIDGCPTEGRPVFLPGQEWMANARADRADVRVERYVGEGMTRTEALTKASVDFGYTLNKDGKGESLRATLSELHKAEKELMFQQENRCLRSACPEEFAKMSKKEQQAYETELKADINLKWQEHGFSYKLAKLASADRTLQHIRTRQYCPLSFIGTVMKLITASDAAACLMISTSTLAHYRCNGNGPEFIKVGRRIFYDKDVIERWLQDHTFKSTSEATERQT